VTSTIAAGTLRRRQVGPPDGRYRWTNGRNRALKVVGQLPIAAAMKLTIIRYALTALLVTATLVHTFGAKWG
jgi:hypothetical protein